MANVSEQELEMLQSLLTDAEMRKAFEAQFGSQQLEKLLQAAGLVANGNGNGINIPGMNQGQRGERISPSPGFVIKTKALESGEKVFINFCSSPKVKSFSVEKNPDEDKGPDGADERLRIPLSLGQLRHEMDKKGVPCAVYDVVLNNEVVEKCKIQPDLESFVVNLAISWIQEKSGGGLDPKYCHPKVRGNYKGSLPPVSQFIRSAALVEELDGQDQYSSSSSSYSPSFAPPVNNVKLSGASHALNSGYADASYVSQQPKKFTPVAAPASTRSKQGVREPVHCIYVKLEDGVIRKWDKENPLKEEEFRSFEVQLDVPLLDSARDAKMELFNDGFLFEVDAVYRLRVKVPYPVDDKAGDAAFDRKKKQLKLSLPLAVHTKKAYERARMKQQEHDQQQQQKTPPQQQQQQQQQKIPVVNDVETKQNKEEKDNKNNINDNDDNDDDDDDDDESLVVPKQKLDDFECPKCGFCSRGYGRTVCARCKWEKPADKSKTTVEREEIREIPLPNATTSTSHRYFTFTSRLAFDIE